MQFIHDYLKNLVSIQLKSFKDKNTNNNVSISVQLLL
jgi:hypothetical protein